MQAFSLQTLQEVIDYIEDHVLEPLSPASIAGHFYLNVTTLNNLFKLVCNLTLMEYIRNRRLSLAGQELLDSNIHIIDLAFKYGYETPEAFTKAFTRFHGFPPSFVRRTYPKLKVFYPLQIKFEIQGGWEGNVAAHSLLTKQNAIEQEKTSSYCYDETIKSKGGIPMENVNYHINLQNMKQQDDWNILLSLAQKLNTARIKFKVDGKTMIFAHGLEFPLEKICLTFKWDEEQKVKNCFGYTGTINNAFRGFKYFDILYKNMKVRCMFYGDCLGDNTDEFLFRNAEPVNVDGTLVYVQTLEFYHQNAAPDDKYYKMVAWYLKNK